MIYFYFRVEIVFLSFSMQQISIFRCKFVQSQKKKKKKKKKRAHAWANGSRTRVMGPDFSLQCNLYCPVHSVK